MTRPNYTALDAALLNAITTRAPIPFALLALVPDVRREAYKHEQRVRGHAAGRADDKPAWRFIEQRLQALRKQGLIRYTGKGWVVP